MLSQKKSNWKTTAFYINRQLEAAKDQSTSQSHTCLPTPSIFGMKTDHRIQPRLYTSLPTQKNACETEKNKSVKLSGPLIHI